MTRRHVRDSGDSSPDSGAAFLAGAVAREHLPGAPELRAFSAGRGDTDDDECGPGGTGAECTPPETKGL